MKLHPYVLKNKQTNTNISQFTKVQDVEYVSTMTHLWRIVKQPLSQMRQDVIHVLPIAILDDSPGGLDGGHSYPGVLVRDVLHQRLDQAFCLHVEMF